MTDESLFAAALEQPAGESREAFLKNACAADAGQRDRVAALLAAHDKAGEFLNRPAVERPDPEAAPTKTFHDFADAATRTYDAAAAPDPNLDVLGFLEPATRPDSLGRIGHYEVLEILGRGGFGIVFRAFDEVLQRVVAVKLLAPQMAAASPARKRFIREAQSSAKVRHENVVQIHATEEQPLPYLVMEFIPGETLQERLDRSGPLELPDLLRFGRQIADGLAAAHAQGLVHRDIKPANVMIEAGPQEHVKLTDFGLARAADDASISQSGVVAGTPMYMAPEQAKGESLDHRADLFSLGSVLYVMCTGRPPFRATSTIAVLKRVAEDAPRPIREIIPEAPDWFCRIVEKLHAKDAAERFQSAREVADVLADCEAQIQAHAALKDFSRIPPAKTRGWGRWTWAAAILAVLLALGAGARWGGGLFHDRAADADPPDDHAANPAPEPVWVPLFNGTDLSGWKVVPGQPDVWSVENGVLVGKKPRSAAGYSYLTTERQDYTNFHLSAEVRIGARSNSGIFFRGIWRSKKSGVSPEGYEAQIRLEEGVNDLSGSLGLNVTGFWHTLVHVTTPAHKPDEWFTLEVIAEGSHLETRVNGKTISSYRGATQRSGGIYLEATSSTPRVEFRNIKIKESAPDASSPSGPEINIPGLQGELSAAQNSKYSLKQHDFREIHGVDRPRFDAWLQQVKTEGYVPSAITAWNTEAGKPRFAAVATRQPDVTSWEVVCQSNQDRLAEKRKEMNAGGYRPKIRALFVDKGEIQRLDLWVLSISRSSNFGIYMSPLGALDAKLAEQRVQSKRPISLSTATNGLTGATTVGQIYMPSDGINWKVDRITAADLSRYINDQSARGWQSICLSNYQVAGKLHYMILTIQHTNYSDWYVRQDMLPLQYEELLEQKKQEGFLPVNICVHEQRGFPRYTVIWHRSLDDTIAFLREAILKNAYDISLESNLCVALRNKGALQEALEVALRMVRRAPGDVRLQAQLGWTYYKLKDYTRAADCYAKVIRLLPRNAQYRYEYGQILEWKPDLDRAVSEYQEALRLDPRHVSAMVGLGNVQRMRGDVKAAIPPLQKAILLQPDYAMAHAVLGICFLIQEDLDRAIPSLRTAAQLSSEYKKWVDLAVALQKAPKNDLWYSKLGNAFYYDGDYETALTAYRKASKLNPKDALWHYWIAFFLLRKKDGPGALVEARETVRLDPGVAQAHRNLARALEMIGDHNGADAEKAEARRLEQAKPPAGSPKKPLSPRVSAETASHNSAALKKWKGMRLGDGGNASWSSGGRWIAFGREVTAGIDVHDFVTGKTTSLVAKGKFKGACDPAIAPGKPDRVAFTVKSADLSLAHEEVWLSEGGKLRKAADGGYPSWLPDGRTLLWRSALPVKLWRMDVEAATPKPELLATLPASASFYPSFSSDGRLAAYADGDRIAIHDLQTGTEKRFPFPNGQTPKGFFSKWHPGGRYLGFGNYGSYTGQEYGLWMMDAQTGELRQVLWGGATMPVWSPDGKRLAFDFRKEWPSGTEIWLMDAPLWDDLIPVIRDEFDAVKAKEFQAAWAKHLGVPVEATNSVGMKLRLIPPGSFSMTPQLRVAISKPYFVASHETTVAQFRKFVDETGYRTVVEASGKGGILPVDGNNERKPEHTWRHPRIAADERCPVGQIAWTDALEFCKWLSKKEGIRYRLPTEAEWEWACRAGNNGLYHFGNDPEKLGEYAWFHDNSGDEPHPVGLKKPNAWGLFDMHGNIAEHCNDWYQALAPQPKLMIDPTGPKIPPRNNQRVIRSYGYVDNAKGLTTRNRASFIPDDSWAHFGFRVVCEEQPPLPAVRETAPAPRPKP